MRRLGGADRAHDGHGGMVPAPRGQGDECFQEALRLRRCGCCAPARKCGHLEHYPDQHPQRDLVEMDVRSLVIAQRWRRRRSPGWSRAWAEAFEAASQAMLASGLACCAAHRRDEDGHYRAVARWSTATACSRSVRTHVSGERLRFDLTGAPPQVPHFFNSKAYILRAAIVRGCANSSRRAAINQALYDVVEIDTLPGSLVIRSAPADRRRAHGRGDRVDAAAWQCLSLAITPRRARTAATC